MKPIFVIFSFILALLVTACSSDEQLLQTSRQEVTNMPFENVSLILHLQQLNDSLLTYQESRGIKEFFQRLDGIAIIIADIRGAIDGAKWGSKLLGPTGSVLGADIGGIAYSAMAAACCSSRASSDYPISQLQVELAYVAAVKNDSLLKEQLDKSIVCINIPQKYDLSYKVGLYHNAALKIIREDIILGYELEEGLTPEEIIMLHSEEFRNNFIYSMNNPHVFSFDYISANQTKEDRVIQLFLQAYQEYPSDVYDVNYLINKYIEIIENDSQITDTQKCAVYSALSTAIFSTNYWINNESE